MGCCFNGPVVFHRLKEGSSYFTRTRERNEDGYKDRRLTFVIVNIRGLRAVCAKCARYTMRYLGVNLCYGEIRCRTICRKRWGIGKSVIEEG